MDVRAAKSAAGRTPQEDTKGKNGRASRKMRSWPYPTRGHKSKKWTCKPKNVQLVVLELRIRIQLRQTAERETSGSYRRQARRGGLPC